MNTPPVLDQTSIRLWPSRFKGSLVLILPLLFFVGGRSMLIHPKPDSFDQLWGIVQIVLGLVIAIATIRSLIVYRPRYILSSQGVVIVGLDQRLIYWHEIEYVESHTQIGRAWISHFARLHLRKRNNPKKRSFRSSVRQLFVSDPNLVSLWLDMLTIKSSDARELIQKYHRQYARPKRK